MLKTILSIAGKPGLYKLISSGKNMLIVETVDAAKKRIPAYLLSPWMTSLLLQGQSVLYTMTLTHCIRSRTLTDITFSLRKKAVHR